MRAWFRFLRRREWDAERARELESHIELQTERNIERGMPPEEAARAARLKLGNPARIREEIYEMNTLGFFEKTWHDLRYAVRGYRRSPGFTLVALLSLTLGIGATTAIFSVIYGVLISPYPYEKSDEIWAPMIHDPKTNRTRWRRFSVEELLELQKLPAVAMAMGTGGDQVLITGGNRPPESLFAPRMSPGAFNFLGVPPVIGRTIQPSDQRADGTPEPVTVISFKMWHRLFDGNPNVLGQELILNGVPHAIVGVMPPRFGWYGNDGLWLPLGSNKASTQQMVVILRLAPGVSPKVAEEQLEPLYRRWAKLAPRDFPPDGVFSVRLRNYMDMTVASGEMKSSLTMLLAAVSLLLLIACANVANLQLARTAVRAREIGVRLSIGAGPRRILRQLLTESLVLSLAGGALGIAFAYGLTKAITALMPEFYVPNEARITVNLYVLLFAVGVSILTGVLFGLAPAFHSVKANLVDQLREGTRGAGISVAGNRTRKALVVVEVALSVVLLAGAALAIRGFTRLQQVDLGFRPDGVITVGIPFAHNRYPTFESRNQFARELTDRVRALPGVESLSIGYGVMPFGGPQSPFTMNGQTIEGAERIMVGMVAEGYLKTLGMRLLQGRGFTEAEVARHEPVALINETAAKLWPGGQSPIGGTVQLEVLERSPDPEGVIIAPNVTEVRVVGIVGDTRNSGLSRQAAPAIYIPYTIVATDYRRLAVRMSGDPMQIVNPLRRIVQSLDREQAVDRFVTLNELVGSEVIQPRFNMALFSFFALVGVALAAAGIFSLISYQVTQRTHEIGIRVALGAGHAEISRMVLGYAAKLVAVGLAIGMFGAFVLVRTVRTQAFDVTLFDLPSAGSVAALLIVIALIASYIPARRAARVEPVVALRQD